MRIVRRAGGHAATGGRDKQRRAGHDSSAAARKGEGTKSATHAGRAGLAGGTHRYGFLKTVGLCADSTFDLVDCSTLLVTTSTSDGLPTVGTTFSCNAASSGDRFTRTVVSRGLSPLSPPADGPLAAAAAAAFVIFADGRRRTVSALAIAIGAGSLSMRTSDCAVCASCEKTETGGSCFDAALAARWARPSAGAGAAPSRPLAAHAATASRITTAPARTSRLELPRRAMLEGTRGARRRVRRNVRCGPKALSAVRRAGRGALHGRTCCLSSWAPRAGSNPSGRALWAARPVARSCAQELSRPAWARPTE